MIGQSIQRIRKEKNMSQEELATELHVVRQTVSKWEKGLSVPDAHMLLRMAQVLDVSINEILGTEEQPWRTELAHELAMANERIAMEEKEAHRRSLAAQKQGLILSLSMFALIAALTFQHQLISLVLVSAFTLSSVIILYRNLPLLSALTTQDPQLGVLKTVTIFNIVMFAVGILGAVLIGCDLLPVQDDGRMFAMVLIGSVMIFSGIISPKLPYTRHTGLRLPWTVTDQDTWNLAHRTLGITALPTAILYAAAALTIDDFNSVTLCAVVLWVGIPAVISYIFYYRKMHTIDQSTGK